MVQYICFTDPSSEGMDKKLKELSRCPGTCFFIDIINSTDIKYKTNVRDWGRKLNNTFNFISFLNDFPDNVVKGIGDELMIYIPDEDLKNKTTYTNYFALLNEIFATLDNIKNYPLEDVFLHCKVSIHYCTEVYNISFFKGVNDYYGQDIDLTARLMSKAKKNRIVLSEKFFSKVKSDVDDLGLRLEETALRNISPKYIEDFKGVPSPTEFRVLDV